MSKYMFTYKHSSYAIIISLGAGILTGLYIPVLIPALKALSSIYVTLLKMCVIPIILSSVSVSFARLIHNNFAFRYFLRLGFLILLMMLCISLIAPLLSLAFPSMLVPNDAITRQLSTIALENDQNSREVHPGFKEISFFTPDETASERESKISSFIHRLIPQNIFEALSMGETLKVVFYFSLFGISLSSISEKKSHTVLKVLEEIYSISQYMMQKVLLLFPIGLWAITAGQFATFGVSLVSALTSLLVFFLIGTALISFASVIIMRMRTGIDMHTILRSIKEMVILAMGTCNSIAAIPVGIKGLLEHLKLESYRVEGPFTLTVTLCRHGSILVFSTASVFALYLYNVPRTFSTLLYVALASIFAAAAGTGTPGIIARSMVSIVLLPLGIPAEIIIVMLQVLDPFIDPFSTLLNILPNYTIAALMGTDRKSKGGIVHE